MNGSEAMNDSLWGNGSTTLPAMPDYCTRGQPMFRVKYFIVMVAGTSMAAVSAVENLIVFCLFNSRAAFRSSHTFFLKCLAIMDVLVAVSYIATFPVEVIMNDTGSLAISRVFHSYIRPLFAISQLALTSSQFLILAASFERWVSSCRRGCLVFTEATRRGTAALAIGAAFLVKGSVYFETDIIEMGMCDNQRRWMITYSALGRDWYFNTVVMFWLRHLFSVFAPFALIAYMNAAIVQKIRRNKLSMRGAMIRATVGTKIAEDTTSSVRRATRMLLLVVASYLSSNILNVAVAVWEHVDLKGLLTRHLSFYAVVTDVISLLTITATALRLPIYLYCNVQVRSELGMTVRGNWLARRLSTRWSRPGGSVDFANGTAGSDPGGSLRRQGRTMGRLRGELYSSWSSQSLLSRRRKSRQLGPSPLAAQQRRDLFRQELLANGGTASPLLPAQLAVEAAHHSEDGQLLEKPHGLEGLQYHASPLQENIENQWKETKSSRLEAKKASKEKDTIRRSSTSKSIRSNGSKAERTMRTNGLAGNPLPLDFWDLIKHNELVVTTHESLV